MECSVLTSSDSLGCIIFIFSKQNSQLSFKRVPRSVKLYCDKKEKFLGHSLAIFDWTDNDSIGVTPVTIFDINFDFRVNSSTNNTLIESSKY